MPNNTSWRHKTVRACTLLDNHADEIESIFPEILNSIREGLQAERVVLGRDGDPVHLGADHATRIAASNLFVRFLTGSRKLPPDEGPEPQAWTLDDILAAIREANARVAAEKAAQKQKSETQQPNSTTAQRKMRKSKKESHANDNVIQPY